MERFTTHDGHHTQYIRQNGVIYLDDDSLADQSPSGPTMPTSTQLRISTDPKAPLARGRTALAATVAVLVVALGLVLAFLFVRHSGGSGAGGTASSTAHSINGTFQVVWPTSWNQGSSCYVPPGWGGESDGDQVIVTDGSGSTIGTGTLTDGVVKGGGCSFTFVVTNVPHESFYSFVIDGHSGPQYSYSQLSGDGWNVSLSLTP
jgi:hypothetical protein